MRKLNFGLGLTAMCLCSSAFAKDDVNDFTPSNISVRIGIGLPLNTGLSNYGSPLFAIGAEYTLNRTLLSNGVSYISLDYLTASTQGNGGVFPLCLNERFYFSGQRNHRTYGFLGIGAADLNTNKSNFVVAARGGIGADLGEAIFVEGALLITDSASGVNGDSLGLYLGYRF